MHKLIYTDQSTFEEAVQLLDRNGNGILPVVSHEGKLVGIVTDGDVRRAILRKHTDLKSVINYSPTVSLSTEPRSIIVRRLQQMKRRHMPVVDLMGNFVEIIVLNDFNEKAHSNRVVIMAGGLGTRLGDLTKDIPKPMLSVNGKPILLRIVEGFMAGGFHHFVFCLNYKSEIIRDFFGNGQNFGASIEYTIEDKRLGTAGALSLIDKEKLREPFIVTNGDVLTSLSFEDFLDAHLKAKTMATLCVKQYDIQLPYANVTMDEHGNLDNLEEKPSLPFYINAGVYAIDPAALAFIPYNEYFDMPSLIMAVKNSGRPVKTFKMDDYWIDIGQLNDYSRANLDIVR